MLNNDQKPMVLICVTAAPLLHTASGCSWPAVALTGIVCLAVCLGLDAFPDTAYPAWYGWLRWLWGAIVVSQLLFWVESYWREQGGLWIPLILLALSAWTAAKGASVTARCTALLGIFLLAAAALVLLSGVPEIQQKNLAPDWQLTGGNLITAFLLPALMPQPKRAKSKGWILLLAMLASVMTVGVLGTQNCWDVEAPFYELSRSLTLFGVTKRFESITAAAMTIGIYLAVNYVSIQSRPGNGDRTDLFAALISAAFLLFRLKLDSRFLAVGCVLIWVFLPTLLCGKNIFPKSEKNT